MRVELFSRWIPRRWVLWMTLAVVGVIVLGLVALLVTPRLPLVKKWRASALAAEALVAIDLADWQVARTKAAAAYQLRPGDALPLRAAARLSLAANDPNAVEFYRRLVELPDATKQDRLGFARAAMVARSMSEARDILEDIEREHPGDPETASLLGRVALSIGATDDAIRDFQRAAESDPSKERRFELCLARLQSSDPSVREQAGIALQRLAAEDPGLAESAHLAISGHEGLPLEIRRKALEEARLLPEGDFFREVLLADHRAALDPASSPEVFEKIRREASTPEEREAVARVLVRHGLPREAMQVLPLGTAKARRGSLLVWLDAAAAAGDWQDVLNVVRSEDVPLDPPIAALFAGRAFEELGDEGAASTSYHAASRLPERETGLRFYIAGYLHQRGRSEEAAHVLSRMLGDPLTARFAAESLVNLLRSLGDTAALAGHMRTMAERWPDDVAVRNDLAYLDLLLGKNLAASRLSAEQLIEADPTSFPPKITYALALVRAGRPREAMEIFQSSQIRVAQLLPFQRAIFAGVLRANGFEESAAGVMATLEDDSGLLPEEKQFAGLSEPPTRPER